MNTRRTTAVLALGACLLHAIGASAQQAVDIRSIDERLKRLERLLGSESLLKLFDEVESLGIEVRELRGQLEEQAHAITQLRQSQRELYQDTDQRLQRIESASPVQAAGPSSPPVTPSAAPAASAAAGTNQPAPAAAATPSTQAPAAGVDPFAEQQAYQTAFELLKSGRYEDAAVAFKQFIAAFPAGSYADNAQYWLGETYYITRQFEPALQEFQRLVSTHPSSQKLTHALLKMGYAHDELGNKAEAERVLGDLIERYPQSAAAGLARKRLSIRE